jgi:hypothetical protein
MTSPEEKLKTETKSLIEEGLRILSLAEFAETGLAGKDLADVSAWVTRLGQLVRTVYGEKSQQFDSYNEALKTPNFYYIHCNNNAQISRLVGVAKSTQHDIEQDLLFDFRALVQADVFADFLEMAEYLLSGHYKDPSAVLAGSVLEEHLRKLALKNVIPITFTDGRGNIVHKKADTINADLVKASVYNVLQQKNVTAWLALRNNAAHGQYSEYSEENVSLMLKGILLFMSQFPV